MSKELLTEILEAVQGESRHSSTGLEEGRPRVKASLCRPACST